MENQNEFEALMDGQFEDMESPFFMWHMRDLDQQYPLIAPESELAELGLWLHGMHEDATMMLRNCDPRDTAERARLIGRTILRIEQVDIFGQIYNDINKTVFPKKGHPSFTAPLSRIIEEAIKEQQALLDSYLCRDTTGLKPDLQHFIDGLGELYLKEADLHFQRTLSSESSN